MVSRFIQGQLSVLKINDPYRIRNSQALVDFLRKDNPSRLSAASIDVEDLYYSLPHSELVENVKVCITQHNDELEFRSRCGLTVEAFLELLMVYLQSTVVGVGKDLYVQKAGVCIGSAVAPILSDMFLSRVDRKVSDSLAGTAEHILRYVDDYLVFVPKDNYNQNVINVLKVFRENSCGLKFTIECVQDKSLQFLDIKLLFKADHVCWRYSPRAKKPLLNFASSHSKVIKNAIASSCFRSSLLWSCVHEIASSFQDQLGRLRAVGYRSHLLNTICKRLIPVIKGTE